MNLIIDFGNSFAKIVVLNGDKIVSKDISDNVDIEMIADVFNRFPEIKNAVISSVTEKYDQLTVFLKNKTKYFIELNENTLLPFMNLYKTPSTLGKDRLAAVAGAMKFFPHENCLIIDAGTAITLDFINEKAEYLGGNISPGLHSRFRALHEFTKRLPLLEKKENAPFLGDSTESAIVAGVQNGIVFEIEGYISSMQNKYTGLKVILSGGDAIFFENKLKSNIFVNSDLIIFGLNNLLNYNMENSLKR